MTNTVKPLYKVPSMNEINSLKWNGFNAVSTFSGCGGSSLGYRMAGFKVLWASEFIEAARDSYIANKAPYTIVDSRDIRQVSADDILSAINMKPGELDLFDGSPPCASFSTAGKREKAWNTVKKYSDTKQRSDDLFFEFARLINGVKPKVFVAENVSGLVKGTAKGYFLEILSALKQCGYKVSAKLLDAQWLGVPQARQRLIFVGVRNDLGINPVHPKPLSYQYSLREAIPWIVKEKRGSKAENWTDSTRPSSTIVGSGHSVSPTGYFSGGTYVEVDTSIEKFAIGKEWDKIEVGEQSSKYFNLVKPSLDRASPTITAMGGNLGAASVVHPTEKRKFYISELKRVCGFPDDFILTGTFDKQWERLGRAVPPVMMSHIAAAIRDEILCKIK